MNLNKREKQVLLLCLDGKSIQQSASELGVTDACITLNLRNAKRKLGESDKLVAAKRARREGII